MRTNEVLPQALCGNPPQAPLVSGNVNLREAIACERQLLEPITIAADLVIDTSNMGVHGLRERIRERIDRRRDARLALMSNLRLQERNPRRRRFRFRRPQPAEPVLDHSFAEPSPAAMAEVIAYWRATRASPRSSPRSSSS